MGKIVYDAKKMFDEEVANDGEANRANANNAVANIQWAFHINVALK